MVATNKVIKIGVIGPRSYNLGGHDPDNPIRGSIRGQINDILFKNYNVSPYTQPNITLLGITSLALGAEQDFAYRCYECSIDYMVYTPFEDQEGKWVSLPGAVAQYKTLYKAAISRISLGDGGYSPKKINIKNRKIIKDADVIIFIENPLKRVYSDLVALAITSGKRVYTIVPGK